MIDTKRVVITGFGIVSSIGINAEACLSSLKNNISGIKKDESHVEFGYKSQISGRPGEVDISEIDRKSLRFMGEAARWVYVSFLEALKSSNLTKEEISHPDIGLIVGSGGPSTETLIQAADKLREKKNPKFIGPTSVPKAMSSTLSATLAVPFAIKGVNYSISSACTTSAHCIGNAYELIKMGKQKMMFAGGGEDLHWSLSSLFDAMGAMSSNFNDTPENASRAYDKDRDGFVISGGGGIVILEDLEHALERNAPIYGELLSYAANSDGFDMVAPSGEGAQRCMELAMKSLNREVDYINTHGTATKIGDEKEIQAIKNVFKDMKMPFISSTKSLTGHCLGGAGVHELIYSLLMMKNNFLAESANIFNLDPLFENVPILMKKMENINIDCFLSNSFGFGGTNATLIAGKYR